MFPNARGGQLSAHGVHYLLARHVAVAARTCPSLGNKRVSPHVLRHAAAMDLLQQGVDLSVIALWLGHTSIETTQIYLDADLELKQRVPRCRRTSKRQAWTLSTRRQASRISQ